MKPRRAPASITLVLIGAAALSGCGEEVEQRDVYKTRADCARDWGSDGTKCEPAGSGAHTGYYYGPAYRGSGSGSTTLPRAGSNAIASAPVTRGGFGSSASSHSSGG